MEVLLTVIATLGSMNTSLETSTVAFVGGGNMASAIIGGLRRQGLAADRVLVVEPFAAQRDRLLAEWGVQALERPSAALAQATLVVWAVKPQSFREAAAPVAEHVRGALHLSVMAGITTDAMAAALQTQRIVRAMPNTPALIGQGIAGLFARPAVNAADKALVDHLLSSTGERVWVEREPLLDAVTALSGSGPAYVFYFIEAMMRAGQDMGLSGEQARLLAQSTFAGAAQLAKNSSESPAVLRERVTSKGGTTYAAITSMQDSGVGAAFEKALQAACLRAQELGREFG
jgi:pyrroline-5-carboxylate reductase